MSKIICHVTMYKIDLYRSCWHWYRRKQGHFIFRFFYFSHNILNTSSFIKHEKKKKMSKRICLGRLYTNVVVTHCSGRMTLPFLRMFTLLFFSLASRSVESIKQHTTHTNTYRYWETGISVSTNQAQKHFIVW